MSLSVVTSSRKEKCASLARGEFKGRRAWMKDFSVVVRNAAVEGTADGLRRGGLNRG